MHDRGGGRMEITGPILICLTVIIIFLGCSWSTSTNGATSLHPSFSWLPSATTATASTSRSRGFRAKYRHSFSQVASMLHQDCRICKYGSSQSEFWLFSESDFELTLISFYFNFSMICSISHQFLNLLIRSRAKTYSD